MLIDMMENLEVGIGNWKIGTQVHQGAPSGGAATPMRIAASA